jgi:hypothetical protein
MAVRTHSSGGWRTAVCAAPLLGVVFLVWAALQGEPGILRALPVYQGLSALSALGVLVGVWTWRRMAAIPVLTVAQASPGLVTVKGTARPLPGDAPLLSPNGETCLWFHHSERVMHRTEASDSVRPFLLVDEKGAAVVVLPAGADIHGSSRQPLSPGAPKMQPVSDIGDDPDSGSADAERLLREGDAVEVMARFVAPSAEAIELQAKASALAQREFVPRVVIRSTDRAAFERALREGPPPLPAPPPLSPPLALPVLADPGGSHPFVMHIAGSADGGSLYAFAAFLDLLVLLGSGGMVLWLLRHPPAPM